MLRVITCRGSPLAITIDDGDATQVQENDECNGRQTAYDMILQPVEATHQGEKELEYCSIIDSKIQYIQ